MLKQNIKSKINKYKKFWNKVKVNRPLHGVDIRGYFPLKEYIDLNNENHKLRPNLIQPEVCLNVCKKIINTCENINDDLIRGIAPPSFIPWLECMLGCSAKISAESKSIWPQAKNAKWNELEDLKLREDNEWFLKLVDFYKILTKKTDNIYPVSQPTLRGVSDLIGSLRGHD
ncbi:MAG: hypothetical protein ACOCQA_02365, partial [bacterium]